MTRFAFSTTSAALCSSSSAYFKRSAWPTRCRPLANLQAGHDTNAPSSTDSSDWLAAVVSFLLYIPAVLILLFTSEVWVYLALTFAFLQYVLHLLYLLQCLIESYAL